MADARADIIIDVDTSVGIAEIKALQRQISQLNAQLLSSGAQQARAAQNVQRNLINNINATEQFSARVKTITSTTESFTRALESNKMSMGQYFKYAGASTQTFGRLFKNEFNTIQKVAESRVKTLQTQYVKLGRDANGALKAIAVRPLALDMENLSTKTAIAAQKQQLFNQLIKQGSTNLLNFGKNTQWAGRQLMVGFSVPLAYLGTLASKTFMKMEEQAIRFKRVYGDSFTSSAETDKMIKQVQQLASEFTKYGVQVEKTMAMAADAAAMGKMGADLLAQINQATRLAVLGGVEQEKALETTISLTNAFGTSAEQLAGKINFLNAVENQTVTAIEDLTIAIPKAAPVIKQLGGNVEDLAFFLTAMKEGGINASEGANALKSGLASLINPTAKASEFMKGFGININGIVEANKGDVKGLVVEFATALDTLDPLNRARAIEQLFGKFQFSRLSTLFQNVIAEGSQAERVLKLSNATATELAILSERELKRVEDSPMYKFKKAVEDLKVSLVPLGEAFLKAITPLVEFAKGFLDKFNSMGEGAKNFAVIATTVVAGIGPVLLMTFGLIANGVANLIKMFSFISRTMSGAGKSSVDLGTSTEYMTQQQLEAAAVASSLDQKHAKLTQTFNVEAGAVNNLATAYGRAVVNQSKLLGINPETGMPIAKGAKAPRPKKYNSGVISVPGPKGKGDIVPAMLAPGEAVIPADMAKKHRGFIADMINDNLPGYRFGLNPFASMLGRSRVAVRTKQSDLEAMLQAGKGGRYKSAFETGTGADYISTAGLANPAQARLRSQMEEKMFGLGPNTPAGQRPTYGYARTSPFQALINKLFGFRGKQYNAITSGFSIGDRGQAFGYKNPKTGMFGPTPNYQKDVLQRYGDIDLITKRSVARRSSGAATDSLMDYSRSSSVPGLFNLSPVSLSGKGANNYDKAKFGRLDNPFGSYKADPVNYPNQYTSNPKPPYVETYTPGGFGVKEISKIVAKDRATARQLQKLVNKAGLKIRVTPQNAPLAVKMLANMFGTRFSDGTTNASTTGLIAAHGADFKKLSDAEAKEFARQNLSEGSRAYKNFMEPTGRGRNVYSNLVFGMPGLFNTGNMTGSDAARWIKNNRSAFFSYLSDMQGVDPNSAASKRYANSIASGLAKFGDKKIDDSRFYSQVAKAGTSVVDKSFAQALSRAGSTYATGEVFGSSGKSRREALAGAGTSYTRRREAVRGLFNDKALAFEGIATAQKPAAKPKPTPKKMPKLPAVPKLPAGRGAAQSSFSLSKIIGAGRGAGAFAGILGMAGLAASMMGSFKQNQYNKGVVSVPGPKGAGDIVPAMLAPGEAVIPAAESKKYAPLIQQMVHGKIPGYVNSNVPKIPGFGTNGLPLDPLGNSQQTKPIITDSSAKTIGGSIGKVLDKGKALTSGLARGITNKLDDSALNRYMSGLSGLRAGGQNKTFDMGYEVRKDKNGKEYYVGAKGEGRISKEQAEARYNGKAAAAAADQGRGARMGGGGALMGMSMAGSMAGMAMMASPDQNVQQMAMPVMLASGILPMLPMLMNPIGGIVASLALVVGGFLLVKNALDEATRSGHKTAKAMSMTGEKLDAISEITGNVTASQIADKNRENQLTGSTDAKRYFGQQYLESDAGKGMLADAEAMKKQGMGNTQIAANFANQLSYAIVQGAVTKDQAASIAAALGTELRDFTISAGIIGNLNALYGRKGENLLEDPLEITLAIQEDSVKQQTKAYENALATVDKNAEVSGGAIGNYVAAGIMTAVGLGLTMSGVGAAAGIPLLGLGLAAGGLATAGTTAGMEAFADEEENNKARGVAVQLGTEQIAQNQGLLESLEVQYDRQLAELELKKESVKTDEEKLTLERQINDKIEERNSALTKQKESNDRVFKSLLTQAESMGDKFTDSINLAIDDKFKDATGATKAAAELAKENLAGMDTYGADGKFNNFKATLQLGLASGEFDPSTVSNLINANAESGGVIETKFQALVSAQGTGNANQILQLLAKGGVNAKKIPMMLQYMSDSTHIESDMQALSQLADMQSKYGIDVSLNVKGDQKIKAVREFMDETANLPDVVTKEVIQDYIKAGKDADGNPLSEASVNELQGMLENWDSFAGQDGKISRQVLYDFKIGDYDKPAIIEWYKSNFPEEYKKMIGSMRRGYSRGGMGISDSEYDTIKAEFFGDGGTEDDKKPEPEDPKDKTGDTNPIEDYLKKLKQLRNASIDTTKGLDYLVKLMKDGSLTSTKFLGTDQKLLFAGYGTDFINAVNSMDEETRKKFVTIKNGIVTVKEEGKALAKAMSEIKLGEFQFSLVSGVAAINKQITAMSLLTNVNGKLAGAGLSSAEAFEIVQDESLAYAIATAATTEEIKVLIENFRKLRDAQERLKLSTPEGTQSWLDDYSGKVSNAVSIAKKYIETQKEIVNQDFETGDNKSGKNKDKINVGLLSDNITDAQEKIAEYQYNIDDLQYDLSTIEEVEDKINEKYDERAEALNKIWEANSDIAEQQKAQLDIAQALASGDISAAARAMQEEQRRRAQKAKEDQDKALELAREKELEGVKSTKNKTRKQLEEEILKLTKKITAIEEGTLEPNERLLRLAESARNIALEAVGTEGYLGQTEQAWGKIEAAARLAVVESEAFKESLKSIIDLIPGFSLNDSDILFDEAAYIAGISAPSATVTTPSGEGAGDAPTGGTGSGTGDSSTGGSNTTAVDPKTARIAALNTLITQNRTSVRASAGTTAEDKKLMTANIGFIKELRQLTGDPTAGKPLATLASGGMVMKRFAAGGFAMGTDTVPAMLTPGEFVMRRYAVDQYGTDTMKAINNGTFSGDSVYNYSVNVSVKSNANPDDIASAVMSRINQIDSQRIRSNRY